MQSKILRGVTASLFIAVLTACGGGGGSATSPGTSTITVTGTAATGLAIAGATVTGKCKVGTGIATTLANGSFTLTVIDGQLPCVLQIINPTDGTKLHTLVSGIGSTAVANITPLTEMTTARVLGSEPNVFYAAFDAVVATQKVTTANIAAAQTAINLVFTGTIDTTPIGDFITIPLVAATQGSPTSGDAQDKLLDALKLKLTTAQLGSVTTALANNQTIDVIKQTVISLATVSSTPPVANAGTAQSVVTGTTVTLDASTSTAAAGKTLTYAWTLNSKPTGSAAALTGSTTAKPSFVADSTGSYVTSVIVNDGTTASSASAVTVTASVANAAPVANAGVAQNVIAGKVVNLDGSASSDANGDMLTYVWTLTSKPAGSSAALSSTTSARPTFTADVAGTYVGTLTVNDGKVNSAAVTVAVTATEVTTSIGGIFSTDTVLTADKSPYLITSTVQIAYGTTLTIRPGVTVKTSVIGRSILTYGTLVVAGTSASNVHLDGLSIQSANSIANGSEVGGKVSIAYAKINGGLLMTDSISYGNFSLTDSMLSSVNAPSFSYETLRVPQPANASYIERNIFSNSGGILVWPRANDIYVRNNVFSNIIGGPAEIMISSSTYGPGITVLTANSFLDVNTIVLRSLVYIGPLASRNTTAAGNYWGTTDPVLIQSRIYDKSNDLSSAGYISFLPVLTQPDAATPAFP